MAGDVADALRHRPARRHPRTVEPEVEAELVDATYPLFLEVGRQISPQLFEQTRLDANTDERVQALVERVAADGVALWTAAGS